MSEQIKTGSYLWIKLPYGELFEKNHNKNNTIFIAGGTGITPFISLFTNNLFSNYQHPKLYFGLKSKKHFVYSADLELAKQINPTFEVFYFFENETGIIDLKQIINENNNYEAYFFLSGPPNMIKNCKSFLIENQFQENKIITDEWD
jgi:predicted ferric reductase